MSATYPFTAMNTLKGQRIRAASSAGNAVALENWFNIDKIHKIYQRVPVPLQLLRLEEVYLLASPPGLPIRLVRLDALTHDGQADLFDIQRQETITVNLGAEYQLHKYFPDAVIPIIRKNLNITSEATRNSNFKSIGGGKPFTRKRNSLTNRKFKRNNTNKANSGRNLSAMTSVERINMLRRFNQRRANEEVLRLMNINRPAPPEEVPAPQPLTAAKLAKLGIPYISSESNAIKRALASPPPPPPPPPPIAPPIIAPWVGKFNIADNPLVYKTTDNRLFKNIMLNNIRTLSPNDYDNYRTWWFSIKRNFNG
jgi:hypothetical protein